MQERTAVESPLLDVAAKLTYGNLASVRGLPALIDALDARMTPEEIAEQLKVVGAPMGFALGAMGFCYGMGRLKLWLDAGWPANPDGPDAPDDAGKVFTWWARATRVYRNDGGLVPGEDGARWALEMLPPGSADDLATRALRNGAPVQPAALRRTMAELDMYTFVTHAEARDGIHQHGPYDVGDGRVLCVKEYSDLQSRFQPGITDEFRLPTSRIVVAMVLRDVDVRADLFTVHVTPDDYFSHIEGVLILAGDDLKPITQNELTEIGEASRNAQRKFFVVVAGWDEQMKVRHAAAQYANAFISLPLIAGYSMDEVDELLIQRFEREGEPYYAAATGPDRAGAFAYVIGDAEPVFPPIRL
ncbi:MAG: hypothetical protein QOF76_738 [Solirubrobacteraceae bacterium]|nr:hypothetical protein [Solirubrobacteraceae bacterium]